VEASNAETERNLKESLKPRTPTRPTSELDTKDASHAIERRADKPSKSSQKMTDLPSEGDPSDTPTCSEAQVARRQGAQGRSIMRSVGLDLGARHISLRFAAWRALPAFYCPRASRPTLPSASRRQRSTTLPVISSNRSCKRSLRSRLKSQRSRWLHSHASSPASFGPCGETARSTTEHGKPASTPVESVNPPSCKITVHRHWSERP